MKTFFTRNTDTDISSLNHTDIVGTVSNCKRHDTQTILDQPHDEGLLERRHTAADDTLALHSETQEQLLVRLVTQRLDQRRAVDDKNVSARPVAVVVSDDRRDAGVDTLEGVHATGVRSRLDLVRDAVFFEDAARGEELVHCTGHLGVHGTITATADDDDVVVAADKVRAVSDG